MTQSSPPVEQSVNVASLPQGNEMLSTFLSLMPDAAVAVDADGTIVAVNERTEAFFGYEAQELEGKPIEVLVPERFRHAHRQDRGAYSASPHARPMGAGLDLYARRRDGSEFPVDISLAPIGNGDVPLVVAAVRDITERKTAQAAQAQLAAIVESSGDAIFSTNERGIITSWNPGAEAMFGHTRQQVVGRHMGHFFHDDPVFEELLGRARAGERTRSRDTRWPTGGGALMDVAISVAPLAVGNERGYSVLVRDVTARKAAEAQVRQQARWQAATAEIRLNMLSDEPLQSTLELVCKWAADLTGAGSAAVFVSEPPGAHVAASAGTPDHIAALEAAAGVPDLVTQAIATALPQEGFVAFLPGAAARAYPIGFTPGPGRTAGLLVVAGADGGWEDGQDQLVESLTASAQLAFELDAVRSERNRLLISADRERIARDLHDLVIQRLFGAGLRLQGALGLMETGPAASRVNSTIEDLDVTIKEIREAIFALEATPGTGLRAKVTDAAGAAAERLGFRPSVTFAGNPDRDIPLQVQIEVAAVVREALSNAARHAHATQVDVVVSVDDDLSVAVVDNGVGMGRPARLSGIANARARAALLGGQLDVTSAPGNGTRFEWRVPLTGLGPAQ